MEDRRTNGERRAELIKNEVEKKEKEVQKETRLALIEQLVDIRLKNIDEKLDSLTVEIRKYNGVREKLENACLDIKEHKEGHWRSYGVFFGIITIIFGIFKLMGR